MNIAYLRVSTDKQDCENQRHEVNRYSDKNGLKIDSWYSEVVSGTKKAKDRVFAQVFEVANSGDTLIVSELSRISRSMFDMMAMLNICIERKINLISIKENFIIDNSPSSKMMAALYAFCAEIERERISQRTKAAICRLKSEGAIWGRRTGSTGKTRKLFEKAGEIKEMVEAGVSVNQISKRLEVSHKTVSAFIKTTNI